MGRKIVEAIVYLYSISDVIMPILQMKKLRLRDLYGDANYEVKKPRWKPLYPHTHMSTCAHTHMRTMLTGSPEMCELRTSAYRF